MAYFHEKEGQLQVNYVQPTILPGIGSQDFPSEPEKVPENRNVLNRLAPSNCKQDVIPPNDIPISEKIPPHFATAVLVMKTIQLRSASRPSSSLTRSSR